MKCFSAALVLCTLFAAAAAPPPLVDVFVSGAEGYACYRIPAVIAVEGPGAALLLAYAEGRRFSCDDHGWNDIVSKSSTDGGRTWGPLQVVYGESTPSSNVTIGNPAPFVVANTPCAIFLPFSRNNLAAGVLGSTDCGATYATVAALPVGGGNTGNNNHDDENKNKSNGDAAAAPWQWVATGPPGGLQLSGAGGRYIVPTDRVVAKGDDYESFAFISDDAGGKAWRAGKGSVVGGNECQAAELTWRSNATHSVVHLSMRSSQGKTRLAAESVDGGDTWSEPWATIAETECQGSVASLPASRRLVMSSAFSAAARANLTLHVSGDDGRSWAPLPAGPVYPGSSAYSSLVVKKDLPPAQASAVGVLFERDDYAKISYAEVAV